MLPLLIITDITKLIIAMHVPFTLPPPMNADLTKLHLADDLKAIEYEMLSPVQEEENESPDGYGFWPRSSITLLTLYYTHGLRAYS